MTKVFIDGSAGTTGLRIHERLRSRQDLELIVLPEELRKEESARKEALNHADIAFLCLPDAAAQEAVSLVTNPDTVIIDTSTAHRTAPHWVYGFPEISGQISRIQNTKRIANPGCHASGFVSLVAPLTQNGLLDKETILTAFSLTGYSGGGKKMIAQYEDAFRDDFLKAPRVYGLNQMHKHLPEMKKVCGLSHAPLFSPIVAPYLEGMLVEVMLSKEQLKGTMEDIKALYREYYQKGVVHFEEETDEEGFLAASAMQYRDDMEISVFGNDERITLVSRFDNLGKGASGAAIENMNIVLGLAPETGLNV